jgi:formylglycine-generating enzyme required for sulfatase activity
VSSIFLGYSSANEAEAIAVRDWLAEQGWNEVFLDLDPERGAAGQRWHEALRGTGERCEIVLFLISPAWVASKRCLAEFRSAQELGKTMFGVIVEPTPSADIPKEMTAEWQLVDLTAGTRDHAMTVTLPRGAGTATGAFASQGLGRLRIGLMQSGLSPRYFKWPPDHDTERAPYRGLKPLEAGDAGIFFGREEPTLVALDILRALREAPAPRLLVIVGASGAGKSSFMRAGLLPRLARDDLHFLPLPVIRPERAALTGNAGLIASLERALKASGQVYARSDIENAASAGIAGVAPLLSALADAKAREVGTTQGRKPPTVIIPIDQAEELFTAEGAKEAEIFLELLREVTTTDAPAAIALFTIRADNYEPLLTASTLAGLRQHTFSLPPMPKENYATVITCPLARLAAADRALVIEEPLVQALLTDIEEGGAKDALPLLAFTLERLYLEFHGAGRLTEAQYQRLGRTGVSIEAAVERALDAAAADPKVPKDKEARLSLLRRSLIPWLAGIDPDTGAPRRSVARLSEIPEEARPLLQHLVEQRLLATVSMETGEITIEPMHEVVLRQWRLLHGWLREDAELLAVLDGVKRASRDWAANAMAPSGLAHGAERLHAAKRLLARRDFAGKLAATDGDYVVACERAERSAQKRARGAKVLVGTLIACIIAVVGLSYAGILDESYLKIQGRNVLDSYRPTALTAEKERALRPGDRFQECASCPDMVVIPAGEFMMGSDDVENERPVHRVTIDKPIAIGRFSVTFDEWDTCVRLHGCPDNLRENYGRVRQPVINVNWSEAQQYVTWLSKLTGKTYRLLSEAEWEFAARANTTTRFAFGNDDAAIDEYAWFERNSGQKAHPVGEKKPNAFGLYDMHGNVWQWVEDCYHKTYQGAPTDGSVWTANCEEDRVLRGGSWYSGQDSLRSANRSRSSPDNRSNYLGLGFRVERTLSP